MPYCWFTPPSTWISVWSKTALSSFLINKSVVLSTCPGNPPVFHFYKNNTATVLTKWQLHSCGLSNLGNTLQHYFSQTSLLYHIVPLSSANIPTYTAYSFVSETSVPDFCHLLYFVKMHANCRKTVNNLAMIHTFVAILHCFSLPYETKLFVS